MSTILDPGIHLDLAERALRTLDIMHRWGYAPTIPSLAETLLGGRADSSELGTVLSHEGRVHLDSGLAALRGREQMVVSSLARIESHGLLNGSAWNVALEYGRDLLRICPFLECVAVSGSLASGGYSSADDIDYDLFVTPGTKYTTYLLATAVGLKYSWRYRHRRLDGLHTVLSLPKPICINVVWPSDQTKPFSRQDEDLAFELMRCQPIFGADRFRAVCRENDWIASYFPQVYGRALVDQLSVEDTRARGLLRWIGHHPLALRLTEWASRTVMWMVYRFAQWTRRQDEAAVARMEFLRRAKYPYEMFQD